MGKKIWGLAGELGTTGGWAPKPLVVRCQIQIDLALRHFFHNVAGLKIIYRSKGNSAFADLRYGGDEDTISSSTLNLLPQRANL